MINCEQANQIPIVQILETLGHKPTSKSSRYYKYLSPFREERTPSFTVYLADNKWHDFGTGEGSTAIDLVIKHMHQQGVDHAPADALRWLQNMQGGGPIIRSVPVEYHAPTEGKLVLKDAYEIKHPALIKYMWDRGITESIAKEYLKELRIYNKESKKSFFTLGFKNESNGYDFRNKFMKGCIGKKDISFINGKKTEQDKLHVFEGGTDFLSMLMIKNVLKLENDAIVLHSLSMLKQMAAFIQPPYQIVYTWLDNDKAGEKATVNIADFCKTIEGLTHKPMNHLYKDHKDLNDYLVAKLAPKKDGA